MTKETRVGLLVGLVIVIVFGMILTEFKGTDAPFEDVANQPVVDTGYYKAADPVQTDLAFSPPPKQAEHAILLASADDETPANQPIRIRVLPTPPVRNTAPVEAVIRRNIDEENVEPQLSRNPQPVRLDPQPSRQEVRIQLAQQDVTPPASVRPAVGSTYRVEEGDTLSRIAAKVYGPEKRHLFKKIYEANRGQLADASSIYVGQVLTIPDAGESTSPADTAVAQAPRQTPSQPREVDMEGLRQFAQQPRTTTTRRVYVVQSGDNLTRIARKMLNDGSRDAVKRLYEANKDKLESPDSIVAGMKLQIPS